LCIRSAVEALSFYPKTLTIDVRKELSVYSPILLSVADHLLSYNNPENSCEKFRDFIGDLLVFVDNTTNNETNVFDKNTPMESPKSFYEGYTQGVLAELWATGHCFPSFPALCKIPETKLLREEQDDRCTKTYKDEGTCGAGLVPFWCLEHKMCLGFIVLKSAESPRQIAHAVLCRFPSAHIIMYDNGCRLHEFILNRFPQEAKNMLFLIDSLHVTGHTACSSVYDPKNFPSLIKNMATVLAEQKNAILDRLKGTAPHMSFRSFAALVLYAFCKLNKDQKRRNYLLEKNKH
jgi:Kyakuja-Dileera-Zisupton transposase